jgi:hypothetical protein
MVFYYFHFDSGLSSGSLLTSLKSVGAGSFEWFGGIAAEFLQWAPSQPAKASGDCVGLTDLGLKSEDCNSVHNFLCEEQKTYIFMTYVCQIT